VIRAQSAKGGQGGPTVRFGHPPNFTP